jgi:hypothetical protein
MMLRCPCQNLVMSGAAYPRRGDCVGLCSNLRCDIRLGVATGLVLNYMHCVPTHGQSDGRIKLSIQYQEDDISLCRNHTHISFPGCTRQSDVSDFVHKGVPRFWALGVALQTCIWAVPLRISGGTSSDCFVVFLTPKSTLREGCCYLNLGQNRLLLYPLQFIIHCHLLISRNLVAVIDVLKTQSIDSGWISL